MHVLNPLNMFLCGINLIESSAGTGKTYILTIFYLRLLLHLGGKSAFVRPLTVNEILVVTFTNTAVQSLRNKIKENIRQFRLDCIRGYSNNCLFSKLLVEIHDINNAIHQLLEAEKKINQAPIFTIHSFCQKILIQNTIELNILFDTSITNNETQLYKQACTDFWRKYFYPLPLNIISLVQEHWPNPDYFLKDILPYIYGKLPYIENSIFILQNNNISKYYTQIIFNINNIKKEWNLNKNHFVTIIHDYKVNNRIYNIKNLKCWINKINKWAQQTTINHIIPNDLKHFRKSTLEKNSNYKIMHYTHRLFDEIEKLYLQLSSFKPFIFNIAINEIRQNLKKIQFFSSEVTFNDLTDLLAHNLTNNKDNNLAHIIRTRYPIAIIDEFQDTDQQQYDIFHMLYFNYLNNGLILIGDPKQAIYSFRRADIFTYMQARRKIYNKYTLNINWRASTNMINAVNQLFQYKNNPFIFKDIPFVPSIPTHHSNTYQFSINNQPQKAICFWLDPKEIVTINDYKKTMAQECAITIYNLLSEIRNKKAWIENNKYKRILQASDITVLVRNHEEAHLIQSTFSTLNIPTVFLSNKKNIFETIESYELLLLLQAILSLDKNMIFTALTTIFFRFDATNIENIKNNELQQEQTINEFSEYYSIWKTHGIYSMICEILFKYKITEKLLCSQKGKTKLINILHLIELLQNISIQLKNEHKLTQWLLLKIKQPKNEYIPYEQLLRLNNDYQSIKISTIHKAKGLEFPLIFLPFMANFNHKKTPFFHDRKSYKAHLNFDQSISHIKLTNEEHLAEDLRLLYVAITRSIYHCSIGIAPIVHKYKKKSKISDLHLCALGYLIQQNISGNSEFLKQHLKMLNIRSCGDISFRYIKKLQETFSSLSITTSIKQNLSAKSWTMPNTLEPWTITSYSKLKNINVPLYFNINTKTNINTHVNNEKNDALLTPHTFPQGKICGNFFHNIFEKLDFTKSINQEWLQMQIDKYNFDPIWYNTVQKWIYTIINTPINIHNLTLSKIACIDKKTELKFFLPINTYLTSDKLNSLCKYYDSLSYKSSQLNFLKIKGMLKGFIDLIFRWNKKYYIIDYKTNWLGENNEAYNHNCIEKEIIQQHYTLQYQFYTLALHRFLRNRMISYDYKENFGGIYYLFIRGMDGTKCSHGIYFIHPLSPVFIEKLDNLFIGK